MKWKLTDCSKTMTMFHRTITQDAEGRDIEFYIEFDTDTNKCILHLALDGDFLTSNELTWENGLVMLEKQGFHDEEMVDRLYEFA